VTFAFGSVKRTNLAILFNTGRFQPVADIGPMG
jgi:hypothetical protein